MKSKPKVTTTIERKVCWEFGRTELIDFMVGCGIKIPRDADVYVDVPGGGDWSNMRLDVDADCPLIVRWTERTEENE